MNRFERIDLYFQTGVIERRKKKKTRVVQSTRLTRTTNTRESKSASTTSSHDDRYLHRTNYITRLVAVLGRKILVHLRGHVVVHWPIERIPHTIEVLGRKRIVMASLSPIGSTDLSARVTRFLIEYFIILFKFNTLRILESVNTSHP